MLPVEQLDLSDLALALEDHSGDHSWWLDPETGRIEPRFESGLGSGSGPEPRLVRIEPLPTTVGYRDMEDFVAQVRDPRARDQLERAISGRGAFRRFKDALFEHPALRRAWFAFHDTRGERRGLEWLVERGLLDRELAQLELELRPEPSLEDLAGVVDAQGVAVQVARDLRRLYRGRLKEIVLAGPWARGGVHPEAELELIVVLERIQNRWEEKRRMDRIMWRHSVRHDTVVTVVPITPETAESPPSALLARALEDGVRVA
jgi:hypothetical protein